MTDITPETVRKLRDRAPRLLLEVWRTNRHILPERLREDIESELIQLGLLSNAPAETPTAHELIVAYLESDS